jgi:L-alanine-DL-glutamate epimerase-like enolase superfamily enzyme
MSEYHTFAAELSETIFVDAIRPHDGRLAMGDRPGLGLTPDPDAVAEAKARAASASR